jgi:hypothetical protein
MIPKFTKDAIDRYVATGRGGGHFLAAVLENNLKNAFYHADANNIAHMQDIIYYCYNHIPSECWGSKEKVKAWQEHNGWKHYMTDEPPIETSNKE